MLTSEWQNLSHLMKARYSDYTNDQLLLWAQPRGSHVTQRKQTIDVLDKFTLQNRKIPSPVLTSQSTWSAVYFIFLVVIKLKHVPLDPHRRHHPELLGMFNLRVRCKPMTMKWSSIQVTFQCYR